MTLHADRSSFGNISPESFSPDIIRLAVFLGVLILMMAAEALWPRRKRLFARTRRWPVNLGMTLINTIVLRLMGPVAAVSAAIWAAGHGWGGLNIWDGPLWAKGLIGFLALDLAIYVQHVLSHRIGFLWALHKVHHTDRDFDTTTALRFHPIEILLSMLYKCAAVLALGPSAAVVIGFEMVLNAAAMFNHANLKLPLWLDKALRVLIVTPDMHRVHHSVIPRETHSNFGFNLSIWDRIFATYRARPQAGQTGMIIGLPQYQTDGPTHLPWSLALPFRRRD